MHGFPVHVMALGSQTSASQVLVSQEYPAQVATHSVSLCTAPLQAEADPVVSAMAPAKFAGKILSDAKLQGFAVQVGLSLFQSPSWQVTCDVQV